MLDLCGFSYAGDIRMRWKMENPNKVKNIVDGQLEHLFEIYAPHLKKLEENNIVTIHD